MATISVIIVIAALGVLVWMVKRQSRAISAPKATRAARANKNSPQEMQALQNRLDATLKKSPVPMYQWPDSNDEQDVVGESFYFGNLSRIVGAVGSETTSVQVTATLVPYRHPKYGNAVAVTVSDYIVGHLPKDEVRDFRAALKRVEHDGEATTCAAEVAGRDAEEGRTLYWVTLYINWTD